MKSLGRSIHASPRLVGVALLVTAATGMVAVASCAREGRMADHLRPDYALPEATFVGTDSCLMCHEGKDKNLVDARHWLKEDPRAPVSKNGCESCHGPGSAHVEARGGGDTDKIAIVSYGPKSMLSHRQQSAQCLQCHERDQSNFKATSHFRNGIGCSDCHDTHGAKAGAPARIDDQIELCGSCHTDKKLSTERVSHHPLREGKMKCTDCHNPHGTGRDAGLAETPAVDLCFKCHTEKRGPHVHEHPPVVENCLTCHDPHGSIHHNLLRGNMPYLCQRCHSISRHPGTMYGGQNLLNGINPSSRVFVKSCLNCHPRIHGSNHPSGEWFMR